MSVIVLSVSADACKPHIKIRPGFGSIWVVLGLNKHSSAWLTHASRLSEANRLKWWMMHVNIMRSEELQLSWQSDHQLKVKGKVEENRTVKIWPLSFHLSISLISIPRSLCNRTLSISLPSAVLALSNWADDCDDDIWCVSPLQDAKSILSVHLGSTQLVVSEAVEERSVRCGDAALQALLLRMCKFMTAEETRVGKKNMLLKHWNIMLLKRLFLIF